VDGRADLYALGVIMWQLLTSRLPFEAGSLGELLSRITHQSAPSLLDARPDLSPDLAAVVARCLAKQPESRPANGTQLACELRQLALANAPPPDSGAGRHDPGGEAQCAITP
jgi:serine/threonine-protein kinase